MTIGERPQPPVTRPESPDDLRTVAVGQELLAGLLIRPWGQVSPSIYESSRLVSLAPWLTGHGRRVRYILGAQRPDGLWGVLDGYTIVPTLSAVESMLAVLRRYTNGRSSDSHGSMEVNIAELAGSLNRALPVLVQQMSSLPAAAMPDTPANDLITSAMISSINDHLDSLRAMSASGLGPAALDGRLGPPRGMNGARLAKVRAALSAGKGVPEKVLHALEVASDLAQGASRIRPGSTGAVGASPAATAAWLGGRAARDPHHPARVFLEMVVNAHAGLAPCGIPITVFERAWVLSTLARAGIPVHVPTPLLEGLDAALGPVGTPAAEGLPADADTTSVTLYALGLLGILRSPDMLWSYKTETHFCTWPGEEGFSATVNAHVLEAFGQYLNAVGQGEAPRTAATERYVTTVGKLVALLCDRQEADGRWADRWHASPYYATMCCVVALNRFGGDRAASAIRRARTWTLETQRADGSWGRWEGTAEETAYALQILLSDAQVGGTWDTSGRYKESVTSGCKFLPDPDRLDDGDIWVPALWHDKDLYAPTAIVRASFLAARHLARKRGFSAESQ